MKLDNIPCYGCAAVRPKWRGPKLGWLCLECFAQNAEPAVRLVESDVLPEQITAGGPTSVVQRHADARWTLHVHDSRSGGLVETHELGQDLDAEEAVDEAKWILTKRAERQSTI